MTFVLCTVPCKVETLCLQHQVYILFDFFGRCGRVWMAEDGGETDLEFRVCVEGVGGEVVEAGLVGGVEWWGLRVKSSALEWLCERIEGRRAGTWRCLFHRVCRFDSIGGPVPL